MWRAVHWLKTVQDYYPRPSGCRNGLLKHSLNLHSQCLHLNVHLNVAWSAKTRELRCRGIHTYQLYEVWLCFRWWVWIISHLVSVCVKCFLPVKQLNSYYSKVVIKVMDYVWTRELICIQSFYIGFIWPEARLNWQRSVPLIIKLADDKLSR